MPRPIRTSSTYASSGNGTLSHLGMEDFKRRAGIAMLHVPYRGSAPAMTDLMAGVVNSAHRYGAGDPALHPVRRLAADRERLFAARAGLSGYADAGRTGLSRLRSRGLARLRGSGGDAKERVEALSAAIIKVVQSDEIGQKFATLGVIQRTAGPEGFGAFIKSEYSRWGEIVKATGARVD